jgi:hypothetical protein
MPGCRRVFRFLLVVAAVVPVAALTPSAASAAGGTAAAQSFSCVERSGGSVAGAPSLVRDVRVSTNHRFDRFVIAFRGPLQQFDVRPQSSASFVLDPSGKPVTLQGSAGLLVIIHGAQAHDGVQPPTHLTPEFPTLREALQLGDFEGVVSWGLGLSSAECFRIRAGSRRLVIDIEH